MSNSAYARFIQTEVRYLSFQGSGLGTDFKHLSQYMMKTMCKTVTAIIKRCEGVPYRVATHYRVSRLRENLSPLRERPRATTGAIRTLDKSPPGVKPRLVCSSMEVFCRRPLRFSCSQPPRKGSGKVKEAGASRPISFAP